MGKREKNKKEIRERLLFEAKRLFSNKGFEHTTISEIVKASEIGRGTFYNYFSDLKQIFKEVIDQINREIKDVLAEARKDKDTLYDSLYSSFKAYFEFVSNDEMLEFHKKNQEYIRSVSYGSDSLREIVIDLIEELYSKKFNLKYNTEKDLQLLSFSLAGTAAETFLNIQQVGINVSNDYLASFLANTYAYGCISKD